MERIRLDIIPKGLMPICHASQYDAGRVIRLDLMDGLQGYSLTDEEIELNVRKPDGHIVTASVDVVEGNSFVDIVTTKQMCAVEGENICELKISKDNAEIYSLNFRMMVEKSVTEGGDPSESFIHNLATQIAEGVAEEVATQYDSSNVIFDNEPTSGHGTPYTVSSEGIKTAIDNAFDYDNTASGSIVHIEDGADNIPVKALVSQIVAVESGSGEKSPTNPYTISGFDSGVITRCGKNFVSDKIARSTILTDGSIASPDNNHDMFLAKIKQGVTYTIKSDENTSPSRQFVGAFFTSKPTIGSVSYSGTRLADVSATFTAPISGWVAFRASHDYAYAQCEVGNEQTTFEEYNGNTYTFAFGQTVYGGHFDNKGNLVDTHGYGELDGTENYWSITQSSTETTVFRLSAFSSQAVENNQLSSHFIFSISALTPSPSRKNTFIQGSSGNLFVQVDNNIATTVEEWKTWLATQKANNTPVQICFPKQTPTTVQLTPTEVKTLLGENNIFSYTGDVEVNYYTSKSNDILEFIDSEIGKKNGTNIPIEENSQDSIKDYVDNGLSGKADTSDLNDKQDKNVLNIVKHYDSGTSSDAIADIITEYGKVNMVFAFDVPLGYFTGCLTFANDNMGSGFIVLSTTGRFWVVSYVSGTITLTELT